MLITDSDRLLKRINRKKQSADLAAKLAIYVSNNYPEDKTFLMRMKRQFNCNNRLVELIDGRIIAWFCDSKVCHICNSLRLVKFLNKYLDPIIQESVQYNAVLTIRNPKEDDLKNKIDKMYSFSRNSGLKKDKIFKSLKNNIKVVRSFEVTFNKKTGTFNIHFHYLIAGKNVKDVKLFGKLLIKFWLKYMGDDANRKAQYLGKLRKSVLENFKYLLKLNDVDDSNIHMLYPLLKVIHGRRLFDKMNIKGLKSKINNNQDARIDYKNLKGKINRCFNYSTEKRNFYDSDTKELLENKKLIKDAKRVKAERKNQRIVSDYLKEMSTITQNEID
jgi:hypothetical protein